MVLCNSPQSFKIMILCQESPNLPLSTITSTSSLASSATKPASLSAVAGSFLRRSDDLAPWCQPVRPAADAADACRFQRANTEDIVVVPRSPPVELAPPRPRPSPPPRPLSTAASARTQRPFARKQRREAPRVSRRVRRRTRAVGGPVEGAKVRDWRVGKREEEAGRRWVIYTG